MLKAEWKTIYPLCEFCKSNRKHNLKGLKIFIPLNNSNNEEENNEG
ncbi:19276_t:CDS:1, partial [Dentiscutata erythropus]